MNKVITGLVALAVLALGYVTIKSVLNPVQFDAKQAEREAILQKQLKKIASYEEAYQSIHGRFATAEELADFLANGRLFYIRAEGEVTEAMREQGLTEAEAARRGMIKRDTVWYLLRTLSLRTVLMLLSSSMYLLLVTRLRLTQLIFSRKSVRIL